MRRLATWIARTNDNNDTNFVLIDKKFARIHVFDGDARLVGSSPVLLGGTPGDSRGEVAGGGVRNLLRAENRQLVASDSWISTARTQAAPFTSSFAS